MTTQLIKALSVIAIAASFSIATTAHANKWISTQELAARQTASATTTPAQNASYKGRFTITTNDVTQAAKQALTSENLAENITVTLNTHAANQALYTHNQPVTIKLHALSISESSHVWQAQAYVLSQRKTIAVIPVSGRYKIMQRVPVLSQNMSDDDIISKQDISYINVPESRLNKNTILSDKALIGLSPKGRISANRPIRDHEIIKPKMVEKNEQIELVYTSDFISIRGVGKALENGSKGDLIRVKNADSGRAITARIVDHNKAEVNLARAL